MTPNVNAAQVLWMEQKLVQNLLSVIKGNHSISRASFVIAALTSLFFSPCHAVLIVRTCKHLSYHTSPPSLPCSFSCWLSLSIFPSPLVFFPPPYNQCGF